jgi:asparagine synthase (glutamine-hydrolysing)
MWAFALWDRRTGELFCSRDRFGVKPFYYAVDGGQFLFASEPRALLAVRPALAVPDWGLLSEFVRTGLAAAGERSFFAPLRRLLPACNLFAGPRGVRVERYWDYPVDDEREMPAAIPVLSV